MEYLSESSRKIRCTILGYSEDPAFRSASIVSPSILSLICSLSPQPRTQEVEHFLGVLYEVKELAKGPPILHIYDQHDPKRIVKSIDFIQDYEPSPPFPIVSTGRSASGSI